MAEVNSNIPAITMNINGLNLFLRRKKPLVMYVLYVTDKHKSTERLMIK